MKYRAKFNTPWCKRGEIFKLDNYPEQEKSICYEYKSRAILFDPMAYPDLFEPVEEKSNFEKWQEALFKPISVFDGVSQPLAQALSRLIGMKLDEEGFCADKIYKEVCGEG